LRRRNFDLAIDLQGLLRSGLMSAFTGAPVRVGLGDAREGATRFYTHRIEMPEAETHAVDRLMRVVQSFGIESCPRFLPRFSDDDRDWAAEMLASTPMPRLVLNLGARWLTKRWPPSRFAEVAVLAARERGAGLVAVGAPEDAPLVEELRSGLDGIPLLDLSGRTSLPQLAAVLARADCVLSNDTGPLHLAAATGARVVGIYTCTSARKTGPYGANAMAVSSRVWCAASCVKTCDRMDCMKELTADRVWDAVRAQMDRPRRVIETEWSGQGAWYH
jgi:ADP-heptose:LPS heptosyltransferase